ncbi:beta-lactamase-like protein [Phycomyces blakesleeanus]|uniref:Beta-lactamase-like protein n=1 Tax=Phycomyces blakesleeanus TaxID=4837 RepID=A0ABR3AMH4_PHYBL
MAGIKRKPEVEIPIADENDLLKITPLGAGNEVGRSSILLEYKSKTILLDAGIHPAYNGLASLPFFDEIDPAKIDLLLVTHFHVDHAASVPYLMERTSFKGRVFMTHPTKAIYKWLLSDYLRVSNIGDEDELYNEEELNTSFHRIEAVDYHQQVEVEGIKFTAYNAGHVLGAAMFLIEIAGVKVLYTGDYSREEDRHLMAAEKPEGAVDVLITESTYGVQSHEPRLTKEMRFTSLVHDIVTRGGRCLMPVFALGRAQELLLILDEYWDSHPELDSIPIYYASSLAKKCMAVYQTYINMMNARIRKQFTISNPFIFKHISNLKNVEQFEDSGPCVMMASPGMLQNGLSRELFERWAPDKKNGMVITGYCVENTLARNAMNEPADFQAMDGRKVPLRMSVDYISFSAHVDYTQNSKFIDDVKAPHVILVHGEANAMYRLKSALQSKYSEKEENVKIYTPKNCDTVKLHFRGEKMAKTIGRLASKYPSENQPLNGILVSKDFQLNIMSAEDLNELGGLITTVVTQRQVVPFNAGIGLLKWHLEMMFGAVGETDLSKTVNTPGNVIRVFDTVDIKKVPSKPNQVTLEWIGNSMNDMVADSVLAIILAIDSSPASVKASSQPCHHSHSEGEHEHEHKHKHEDEDEHVYKGSKVQNEMDQEFVDVIAFLEEQFGDVETDFEAKKVTVNVDGSVAVVDCIKFVSYVLL